MATNYQNLWDTTELTRVSETIKAAKQALAGKDIYEELVSGTKVPWWFVAAIHYREASYRFNTHLHNGDPLSNRTKQVPAGRPIVGNPPFTWIQSAKDALFVLKKFDTYQDWDIESILYRLEAYNGFGYQKRGINSPYLWSGTNHYTKGKFVADGRFDNETVDKQLGTVPIIKFLTDKTLGLV